MINNELIFIEEIIHINKIIRNILSTLPFSRESKLNTFIEARNLETITTDDIIENFKTYELKKYYDRQIAKPRKEKNLVFKTTEKLNIGDDAMAPLIRRS